MRQSSTLLRTNAEGKTGGPGAGRGRPGAGRGRPDVVFPSTRGRSRGHGRGRLPQATLDGVLQSAHLGPQRVHGVARNGHKKRC